MQLYNTFMVETCYTHSEKKKRKKRPLYNVIYITAAGTNLSVLHLHLI